MISSKSETIEFTAVGLGMLVLTVAMVFSSLITLAIAGHNVDVSADKADIGRKLCAPHDRLKSFDNGGDFTCKNGMVISWRNEK